MTKLSIRSVAAVFLCANTFGQSVGTKLDTVTIAVHDLEATKRLYSELGFFVPSGNGRMPDYPGTDNSAIFLFPGGVLELIAPYDTSLSGGRGLAQIPETRRGRQISGSADRLGRADSTRSQRGWAEDQGAHTW